MNTKDLWIASLGGAALSLLVTNLPYIGFVNWLLCAGFWGSAIFAVWLYRRLGGTLTIGESVCIGALSGLLAGVHGYVVLDAQFDPYNGTFPHDLASVTKSVLTTLIAIAAEQGKLDLDRPVVAY